MIFPLFFPLSTFHNFIADHFIFFYCKTPVVILLALPVSNSVLLSGSAVVLVSLTVPKTNVESYNTQYTILNMRLFDLRYGNSYYFKQCLAQMVFFASFLILFI